MAVEEAEAADRRGVRTEVGLTTGCPLGPGQRGAFPTDHALLGVTDEAVRQEDVHLAVVPYTAHRQGVSPERAGVETTSGSSSRTAAGAPTRAARWDRWATAAAPPALSRSALGLPT
ncbi:conserved hypothetical protein [Streptomyces pristinaespiralis ATCC 25486]|uniref:Uncharacterized protein n=1 Tax=Streptomyces pristinaespiralis (strain ATCC 25486 / DSM 40338 / CBS 914.69 / JCM 4507 / KCC S-0507 / NBRC 13074 / NRRL 2958 / 5647) TaxID=457429 RepID=B5HEG8_STRE2|nr:conserved hypothetical protein [Streptomyces pristinaespiralis ATCC 25486]